MIAAIGRLLCRLGVHDWVSFSCTTTAFRCCGRRACGKRQFWFSGRGWVTAPEREGEE